MKRQYVGIFGFFIIITVSLFWTNNLYSQEQKSLNIYPSIQEIKANPGDNLKREISIKNLSENGMALRTYVTNFYAGDDKGGMIFEESGNTTFSAKDWIFLENGSLLIEPGKTKNVGFSLKIPRNAEPGGHYAAIFFETISPDQESDRSMLKVAGRFGTLLFITISGEIIEHGQVKGASTGGSCWGVSCSFRAPTFVEKGPVPFSFDFENNGNVHTKVHGKIEIFNLLGNKTDEIQIDEKTVLPGTKRHFEASWLKYILAGRYRAKLTVYYGNDNNQEYAYTMFWAFPWKIALSSFLVVASLGGIIFILKRKKRNKLRKK